MFFDGTPTFRGDLHYYQASCCAPDHGTAAVWNTGTPLIDPDHNETR